MMRSYLLLLGITVATSLPAAAQTSADEPGGALARAARAAGRQMLAPGDVVRITVWRKPELSGEFTIAADSTVRHPLYRDLKIAGLPLAEAEERLRTLLAVYEVSPRVQVEPLLRVTVGGEVRLPNLYSLPPETSIAQAVALSGGPTVDGRLDRVRVVRQGRVMVVNLARASREVESMTIQSGDQIYVGKRRHVWRDVIGPAASLAAATAALLTLLRQGWQE